MPAKTVGIHSLDAWYAFTYAHEDVLDWEPGHFAPALCSKRNGPYLDYYLADRAPVRGDGCAYLARPLTLREMKKYLPVFQKLFPDFTLRQMYDVHYCEYAWYDGTDAPDIY